MRHDTKRRPHGLNANIRDGNYIGKSHRGFALISRVIEVANANAPRRADAPIPDAASCLPLQRGGSAGPWPSNSVAEIGKAMPRPHARSTCHVSNVSAMPGSNHVTFVYDSLRDRRRRFQGYSFLALESEVGPPSNFRNARRGSPAIDEIPATDFRVRPSDRTIRAGLNSRIEPVST